MLLYISLLFNTPAALIVTTLSVKAPLVKPVSVAPVPENLVADKIPVLGTKDRFGFDVCMFELPVVADTKVGYTEVEVAVLFVIPTFTELVAVKLATAVEEVTIKGAVPLAIVEVNCVPDTIPLLVIAPLASVFVPKFTAEIAPV